MGQSVRQQARAKAREAAAVRRRDRAEAEKRRLALVEDVAVALAERDAAVERHELTAGEALRALTRDEGVPVGEVADWLPDLASTEVRRLLRLADEHRASDAPVRRGAVP